ncbi:MAG TPA: hypothetical protein P5571_13070 [Candidatus Krumholzibacteria bacterium]|nr:hypothetical protein [Candidatus Krumholzibacteria bacterium]HRX52293.1 hypothetical protein [Candidatus Krumholzibacteria bacterium]
MNGLVRSILALILLLLVGCAGACREAGDARDAAPPAPAAAAAAPAAAPSAPLPGFPMPAAPTGEDLVLGEVVLGPAQGEVPPGGGCTLSVEPDGARTVLTVLSAQLNCCTERVRASVDASGETVDVRLYEYLPDLCECIHRRSLTLTLDLDAGGRAVRVFFNAAPSPSCEASAP